MFPLVHTVGRKNSKTRSDIELPPEAACVSRRHLEITITANGRLYLVDFSAPHNATEIRTQDRWKKVTQTEVTPQTRLRLGGAYETTVADLLARAPGRPAPPPPTPAPPVEPPKKPGRPEWDPAGGTIRYR